MCSLVKPQLAVEPHVRLTKGVKLFVFHPLYIHHCYLYLNMEKKTYTRICNNCGNTIIYNNYSSYWNANSRNSTCKSCRTVIANKSKKRDVKKDKNSQWKGYKEIPYSWFSKYFERKRKLKNNKKQKEGDITIEQIYTLWLKQDKKCSLSGIEIGFYDGKNNSHTASIDRIDSDLGYILSNVQLVHKDVNIMKNKFSNHYFIEMCKKIASMKNSIQ